MAGKPIWEVVDKKVATNRVRCSSLSAAIFAMKILQVENPLNEYQIKQFRVFDENVLKNVVKNGVKNISIKYTKDRMSLTILELNRVSFQLANSGEIGEILVNENFDGLVVTIMNMVQPEEEAKKLAMALWSSHSKYDLYMDSVMMWRASDETSYKPFSVRELDKLTV